MAHNSFPFIHTIMNSPAILRQRFRRDRAKTLSHGDPAFKVHFAGTEQVWSLQAEQASEAAGRLAGEDGDGDGACKDHVLVVRPRYLEVKEMSSGRQLTKTYLHDIAYCAADPRRPRVFLYICRSRRQLHCRVFRCSSREKAQAITACLAGVFEVAFNQWRDACGQGAPGPVAPALPEGPDTSLHQGGSVEGGPEEEGDGTVSEEVLERRMHREFVHRAASFRDPHRLDRDLLPSGTGDPPERGQDQTHLSPRPPS